MVDVCNDDGNSFTSSMTSVQQCQLFIVDICVFRFSTFLHVICCFVFVVVVHVF